MLSSPSEAKDIMIMVGDSKCPFREVGITFTPFLSTLCVLPSVLFFRDCPPHLGVEDPTILECPSLPLASGQLTGVCVVNSAPQKQF